MGHHFGSPRVSSRFRSDFIITPGPPDWSVWRTLGRPGRHVSLGLVGKARLPALFGTTAAQCSVLRAKHRDKAASNCNPPEAATMFRERDDLQLVFSTARQCTNSSTDDCLPTYIRKRGSTGLAVDDRRLL